MNEGFDRFEISRRYSEAPQEGAVIDLALLAMPESDRIRILARLETGRKLLEACYANPGQPFSWDYSPAFNPRTPQGPKNLFLRYTPFYSTGTATRGVPGQKCSNEAIACYLRGLLDRRSERNRRFRPRQLSLRSSALLSQKEVELQSFNVQTLYNCAGSSGACIEHVHCSEIGRAHV